jgi:hypothetical protein
MCAIVLFSIEYTYRVAVLLGQVAEELAEPRLVLLSHFRSGRHGEANDQINRRKKGTKTAREGVAMMLSGDSSSFRLMGKRVPETR